LKILQIALKALSSKFTVVEVYFEFESKLNSHSIDEKEMKQNLDVLVPKYIGSI